MLGQPSAPPTVEPSPSSPARTALLPEVQPLPSWASWVVILGLVFAPLLDPLFPGPRVYQLGDWSIKHQHLFEAALNSSSICSVDLEQFGFTGKLEFLYALLPVSPTMQILRYCV